MRLIVYLDDLLLMAQSPQVLTSQLQQAIDLMQSLGFVVNKVKSTLVPAQSVVFLGFSIVSVQCTLSLPSRKMTKIRHELRRALIQPRISLRQLARIVGLLSVSIQAIFPGPLHYRALQRLKAYHLRRGLTYSQTISLSEAREELRWWLANMEAWNGRAIFGSVPDVVIESDASRSGWGARCDEFTTGRVWSPEEQQLHINCLELLAGSFAIQCWTKDAVRSCVLLKMDNMSAVRYINHLGSTQSKALSNLATNFWQYCLDHHVSDCGIPSRSGQRDGHSRNFRDTSLWKLHPGIFADLQSIWGSFSVDLFASRLDQQLPRFFSWRPDPLAVQADAFLQDWQTEAGYAFPPFAMLTRVSAQVRSQKADIDLVSPVWRSQAWFPVHLELSWDFPIPLPVSRLSSSVRTTFRTH